MLKPYIGITGLMSREDSHEPLRAMEGSSRWFMAGVLASLKTLRGQENNWKNRYPKRRDISGIFPDNNLGWVLNLIHYNTKETSFLSDQLLWMTDIAGPNLHGFQLNIAWPSPVALTEYRVRYPNAILVLQIGSKAMREVNYNPEVLLNKVVKYQGLVNYVLLDSSGGLGKPLDAEELKKFLGPLYESVADIGYGVAGGLSSTTLNLLEPLVKEFPNLSIDAEGRLRDADDNLNQYLAVQYIKEACRVFSQAVR